MTPANTHMSFDVFNKAGFPAITTLGFPGIQGVGVLGMQGIGVNVPNAAAVAEATTGLANERHIPKGIMLTIGLWSIMFACGFLLFITLLTGNTFSVDGAKPMLHFIIAPLQTYSGINI